MHHLWLTKSHTPVVVEEESAAFGCKAAVGSASLPSAALAVLGTAPDTATVEAA